MRLREWIEEWTREDGARSLKIAGIALGAAGGGAYLALSRFPQLETWALIGAACVCVGPMNYIEKTAGRPLRALNLSAVATLALMAAGIAAFKFF